MSDFIRREDALNFEMEIDADPEEIQAITNGMAIMSEYIKTLPAADVVEQKHGKWIYQFHEDEVGVTCSECEGYAESFARWIYDEGYRIDYNFCPNCGASMRQQEETE